MAKKKTAQARSGTTKGPNDSVPNPTNDPFAPHRDRNQRVQHFSFDPDVFDTSDHDHQVALETIFALNHGMRLGEDFTYRGNVFTGSEDSEQLALHWLAVLVADPSSGRLSFRIHPCQLDPISSERAFVGRIFGIRTGYEDNPSSWNSAQQARWQMAAKLVADWQMPISIITLATCEQPGPSDKNLRLFVPDQPESIYNTMALRAWRLAIEAN